MTGHKKFTTHVLLLQSCFMKYPSSVVCTLLSNSLCVCKCMHLLDFIIFKLLHICTNLLYGASLSKGLWGLVAMLASSASQLVLGEQLSSWWDTPAPTWNKPGDLWSSSTSCSSGMSSVMRLTVLFIISMCKSSVQLNVECDSLPFLHFTIIHVAPRWRRQVLVTLERIKGFVHRHNVLLFPLLFFFNRLQVSLLSVHYHILPHQLVLGENMTKLKTSQKVLHSSI